MAKRKRKKIGWGSRSQKKHQSPSQPSFDLEIPVQQTTMQVPCGEHSIFYAMLERIVSPRSAAVYLMINEHSNWETGRSHGLSFANLSELLGINRTAVITAINQLVEAGWLVKNVRGRNRSNTYQVIHHNCDPLDAPRDKEGYPKKCAVPRGPGSPSEALSQGKIGWRAWLYWIVSKVESNWTTGIVQMTVAEARTWLRWDRI